MKEGRKKVMKPAAKGAKGYTMVDLAGDSKKKCAGWARGGGKKRKRV